MMCVCVRLCASGASASGAAVLADHDILLLQVQDERGANPEPLVFYRWELGDLDGSLKLVTVNGQNKLECTENRKNDVSPPSEEECGWGAGRK